MKAVRAEAQAWHGMRNWLNTFKAVMNSKDPRRESMAYVRDLANREGAKDVIRDVALEYIEMAAGNPDKLRTIEDAMLAAAGPTNRKWAEMARQNVHSLVAKVTNNNVQLDLPPTVKAPPK